MLNFAVYGQETAPSPETQDAKEVTKTELRNVERVEVSSGRGARGYQKLNLSERDKELISMNPDDRASFAAFLDKPETGFFRLHDSDNCDEKSLIINTKEPCPWNIVGKATAYSFRKGKYQRAYFSDIRLRDSVIQIVGVNVLGFLTTLGNVELDKLNLQSDGIRPMAQYQPTEDVSEASALFRAVAKGFSVDSFVYKIQLPIKENTTYALRCVAFDTRIYKTVNGFKINVLQGDKRGDVTVVFRVIRKYEDGSYGILWKELQRKDAPKLKSEKQILK